jgi:hypothetical protein
LQAYLRAHVDPRVEVIYVCGGDNARFAYAFTERGHCIVVARPGAESELERWRRVLAGHPRVQWIEAHHPAASRELRASVAAPLPKPNLVVRLEDERSVRSLGLRRLREFQVDLLSLLSRHANVRAVALDAGAIEGPAISLDALRPARHNLAVSRLFATGGYEALGHVSRPGSPPLEEQVARIPPGRYALHDDDSMSGGTIARVRALLPARVTISATSVSVTQAENEDVVDARDFLLGADDGGLVLRLPSGAMGRSPYVLPYVDPFARASIPASHEVSIDVWLLNAQLFAETELRVRHLPPPARATFAFADDDMRLDALCAWHVERLKRSQSL